MNYILDTHVLLWSIFDSYKLSTPVEKIILDKYCHKFISISTMWEIAIKNRIDKLPLSNGLPDIFSIIKLRGYGIIGLERRHLEIYNKLPLLHRDPFDGIIVATALAENMTIITTDENIQKYDAPCVW